MLHKNQWVEEMVNNRNKSEVSDMYFLYIIENGQQTGKKYA